VVTSEKSLRALVAIRRQKLLPELYGRVVMARSNFEALQDVLPDAPAWLVVERDRPEQELPPRVAAAGVSEAATLRLALALPASLVLLEGPIKERAKLSFIKAEGVVAMLVAAYRQGLLSAVRPMVKALEKLGHGDVVPPSEQMEAMWKALDELG
jgi:predicted nucleic acid-binding protein